MKSRTLFNNSKKRRGADDDSRIISVEISDEGDLNFSASDDGPLVQSIFHRDDYDFGVIVEKKSKEKLLRCLLEEVKSVPPPVQMKNDRDKLLLDLLQRRYNGDSTAVDKFQSFCKQNGVPCRWWCH